MTTLNFWTLFFMTSGVIFWMCILFSAVFMYFAIKHAGEAPDEKIYRDKLKDKF